MGWFTDKFGKGARPSLSRFLSDEVNSPWNDKVATWMIEKAQEGPEPVRIKQATQDAQAGSEQSAESPDISPEDRI